MNDIRARFEEIWPVPDGVVWCTSSGGYWFVVDAYTMTSPCLDHNGKFDVFTRCQETTDIYVNIIDEMVRHMGIINDTSTDLRAIGIARESVGLAKQNMERIK